MRLAIIGAAVLASVLATPLYAKDDGSGKFDHIPSKVREWAKSMKSFQGVPCCEIADGTRVPFKIEGGQYWIPIAEKGGEYFPVPPEVVITDRGNPVVEWCNEDPDACAKEPGDSLAWYVLHGPNDTVFIRCFVPGGGT